MGGGTAVTALLLSSLLRSSLAICTSYDHQECDELCKSDSFWYGHCTGWDGINFSCSCFEYKPPLRGEACKTKQQFCKAKCKSRGEEGGFCYPQSDRNGGRERTGCECFKQLPSDLLRRRREVRVERTVKIVASAPPP